MGHQMRLIAAYSKPTHYSEFKHMSGHMCQVAEGIDTIMYGYSRDSDAEIISKCQSIAAEMGVELSRVSEMGRQQTGYYAGATFASSVIFTSN